MPGNPLFAGLYDRVCGVMERGGLADLRDRLLSPARGRVLEVGAGTGLNLDHYPATVTHLVLTDPDTAMLRRLRTRVKAHVRERGPSFPIEVVRAPAQQLPCEDQTFDEVVVTLVLCSVGDAVAALAEIARVLRPGGALRFLEHVAATPTGPSRLQRLVQPAQRALVGGCRLDHALEASLAETGFAMEWLEEIALPRAPVWNRPARLGVARRP